LKIQLSVASPQQTSAASPSATKFLRKRRSRTPDDESSGTDDDSDVLPNKQSPRKKGRIDYTENSSSESLTVNSKKPEEPCNVTTELNLPDFDLSGILKGAAHVLEDGVDIVRMLANKKRKQKKVVTFDKNKEEDNDDDKVDQDQPETEDKESGEDAEKETSEEPSCPIVSTSKKQKQPQKIAPVSNMVAVGQNLSGEKCFFRLVPMTKKEVSEIQGVCIPYTLQAPISVAKFCLQRKIVKTKFKARVGNWNAKEKEKKKLKGTCLYQT